MRLNLFLMKVFDCFTFFSEAELDLLEIRLRYLSPVVDHFVICESDHVHSGQPKEYILEKNWSRFEAFHDKIVYLQIEQSTEGLIFDKNLSRYTDTDGAWVLEKQQREALSLVNDMVDDEDIVMVGDLDEIPKKDAVLNVCKYNASPTIFSVDMMFYVGFLNNLNIQGPDVNWKGTVFANGERFKLLGPQALRERRNTAPFYVKSGWHLSYMGGLDAIKHKIRSFAHTEFSNMADDDNRILTIIEAGEDVLGRPGVRYELQSLETFPNELRDILVDYPHLIKPIYEQ